MIRVFNIYITDRIKFNKTRIIIEWGGWFAFAPSNVTITSSSAKKSGFLHY